VTIDKRNFDSGRPRTFRLTALVWGAAPGHGDEQHRDVALNSGET
jgi:hypothetical protein